MRHFSLHTWSRCNVVDAWCHLSALKRQGDRLVFAHSAFVKYSSFMIGPEVLGSDRRSTKDQHACGRGGTEVGWTLELDCPTPLQ